MNKQDFIRLFMEAFTRGIDNRDPFSPEKHASDLYDSIEEFRCVETTKETKVDKILFIEAGSLADRDVDFLVDNGHKIMTYSRNSKPPFWLKMEDIK